VEFEDAAAKRNIQSVRPGMDVFKVSKTGERMAEYLEFLESWGVRSRAAAAV
jgi:hypothetical protein